MLERENGRKERKFRKVNTAHDHSGSSKDSWD